MCLGDDSIAAPALEQPIDKREEIDSGVDFFLSILRSNPLVKISIHTIINHRIEGFLFTILTERQNKLLLS